MKYLSIFLFSLIIFSCGKENYTVIDSLKYEGSSGDVLCITILENEEGLNYFVSSELYQIAQKWKYIEYRKLQVPTWRGVE